MATIKNIPQHIGIIMDGNGRWAKRKGVARLFGHKNAIQSVREAVEGCAEQGIQFLTLFTFSTENWERPKVEIEGLMSLLIKTISKEMDQLIKNEIRFKVIGNISAFPKKVHDKINWAVDKTKTHKGMTLILALNYSGQWDIQNTIKILCDGIEKGELTKEKISQETIENRLSTASFPNPELIIRTGGESRISNFYLWQAAYSEFYFTDIFWPDFRKQHLLEALENYSQRERRFGKTSEQIKGNI